MTTIVEEGMKGSKVLDELFTVVGGIGDFVRRCEVDIDGASCGK